MASPLHASVCEWTWRRPSPNVSSTDIVVTITIPIGNYIPMKTIQMTMDPSLVEQVDRRAKRLGTTRSAFTRDALREALRRLEQKELEERQIVGYKNSPPNPQEFSIPESDHAWGDDAWSNE